MPRKKIRQLATKKFFKGQGKRKTAIAQVRLFPQEKNNTIIINGKPYNQFFSLSEHQKIVMSPLEATNTFNKFSISVKVEGGGISVQAEAVRLAIAKAIVLFNPDFKKQLRLLGYLTTDSRVRERKKFGLKRARRAPQWSKR